MKVQDLDQNAQQLTTNEILTVAFGCNSKAIVSL